MSVERRWKVSAGEVTVKGMPQTPPDWHYPIRVSLIHIAHHFLDYDFVSLFKISAHATEWGVGPRKSASNRARSCYSRPESKPGVQNFVKIQACEDIRIHTLKDMHG